MDKEVLDTSIETIETTIGELIATISEIALNSANSEAEAYHVTSLTLGELLKDQQVSWELDFS